MKKFKKIFVEISSCCNLKCEFCPAAEVKPRPFMSHVLFEKILKETKNLTERHCLHVLGEPLLHPDFEKILQISDKADIHLEITSNGLLIKKHLPLLACCKSLIQLNISLHSLTSNLGLEKTLDHIRDLLPSLEVLLDRSPKLFINLRFWRQDEKDNTLLQELLKLYEGQEFVQKEKNLRLRPRLLIHFEKTFEWPHLSAQVRGEKGHCHALSSHFGILSNGTVIPCCLDGQGDIPLGNIEKESIIKILENPKAKLMRSNFDKGILTEELCKRCQYIERFEK
mgnify:CR=1 FL=1